MKHKKLFLFSCLLISFMINFILPVQRESCITTTFSETFLYIIPKLILIIIQIFIIKLLLESFIKKEVNNG